MKLRSRLNEAMNFEDKVKRVEKDFNKVHDAADKLITSIEKEYTGWSKETEQARKYLNRSGGFFDEMMGELVRYLRKVK